MIDLRSDTLTLPQPGMLETILSTPLGDDGRQGKDGRGEDPTVNRLEDEAAKLFGKEAAVLFPSGTLANTAALLTWAEPGQTVLMEPLLHIVKSEKAAFSPRLGQLRGLPYPVSPEGKPDARQIAHLAKAHQPALLLLENSHNFRGGRCLLVEETDALCRIAHGEGMKVHLDGARIFNAAAFTGIPVDRLVREVDSVMFCLSKGLGSPLGSLVACSQKFASQLRDTRKLLGGTLRQAGVIAAPGLFALERHMTNAIQDNRKAAFFHEQVLGLRKIRLCLPVETNIVMLDPEDSGLSANELCARAAEKGLLIRPVLNTKVRLVFHQDISKEEALQAAAILLEIDKEL